MNMRSFVGIACGALVMSSVSAKADDWAAGKWNGFYAGGQVGYVYGLPSAKFPTNYSSDDGHTEIEKIFDIHPDFKSGNGRTTYARDGVLGPSADSDPTGFDGGVHGGYNLQVRNVVFGIEGDYNWGSISGTGDGILTPKSSSTPIPPTSTLDTTPIGLPVTSRLDNLATLRGRLGFTSGPFLLYGTGGVAWVDYSAKAVSPAGQDDPTKPGIQNPSGTFRWGDNRIGWVAGGGVEYLISSNFSVRAEILHYDFGSLDFKGEDIGNIETIIGHQNISFNQVRIGASYHIN